MTRSRNDRTPEDRAAPRGRPLLFYGLPIALVIVVSWAIWGRGGARAPDVVIITIDTLRADASKADMPALHRLATRGTRCAGARTVAPLTLPAHASLFSGRMPAVHGIRDNTAAPLPRDRGFPLLAEEFGRAGYDTAAFVASTVLDARYGLDAGFAHYGVPPEPEPGRPEFTTLDASEQVARVRAWLASRTDDRPRFLWIHLWDPHAPYRPYAGDPLRPQATKDGDLPADLYRGEQRRADAALGSLLELFDADRTLFVVTSDHGEGLGEHGEAAHGFLVYGATMDIPLVLAGPGVPAGGAVPAPSSIVDVAPTLRSLCNLPAQVSEGISLMAPPDRRVVVGESLYGNRLYGWAQLSVATDGRFSLIDGGARLELFDRQSDPRELLVHGDPPRHPAYARLDRALLDYQQQAARDAGEATSVAGTPYGALRRPVQGFLPRAENRPLRDVAASLETDRLLNRVRAAIATRNPPVVEHFLGRLEGLERDDPDNPAPSLERGRALLFVLQRFDEAVSALEEARRRGYSSRDLDRLIVLARSAAAEAAGDRPGALRILEEARDQGLSNDALERRIAALRGS